MAVITVTTASDVVDAGDGETSLREAIVQANASGGADTITFDASLDGSTLVLSQGQLVVSDAVTIDGDRNGDGVADVTLQAGAGARLFQVDNVSATFDGLTLTGGNATGSGGAIFASGASAAVNVQNSTISGNTASGSGGAIFSYSGSSVTITGSTISGNSASVGGGLADSYAASMTITSSTISGNMATGGAGGIYSSTTLTISQSTIADNSGGGGDGGAIFVRFGDLQMTNTTLTSNTTGGDGGGIYNAFSTVNLTNSLVLGNAAGGTGAEIDGSYSSSASIVGGVAPSTVFAATGGATGGGLLADNGGLVQTVALLDDVSNPALDAGIDASAPMYDARGFQTGFDIAGVANNGANLSDIGAYELITTLTVDTIVDENDGDYSAGDLSLREALELSGYTSGNITFASGVGEAFEGGATITLQLGQLVVANNVNIVGGGNVTIDGDNATRLLQFENGVDASLSGVTLTHGYVTGYSGAGDGAAAVVMNGANVNFSDVAFLDNNGSRGGALFVNSGATVSVTTSVFDGNNANSGSFVGGGIENNGTLTLTSVTMTDNSACFGGGIFNSGGLTVVGSTFAENYAACSGGGAIQTGGSFSNATITNSTFVNNSANGGGAIQTNGSLILTNSTLTGNEDLGSSGGGGLHIAASGTANLTNTLILGNSGAGNAEVGGTYTDSGGNLIGGAVIADVFAAVDPVTGGGLLADHGGPVQTVALNSIPSNPALDAGVDLGAPPTDANGNPRYDVSGVANNGANTTDVGAFELQCFAAGTRIATPDGEATVDSLRIGDMVTTADRRQVPVIWAGRQSVITRLATARQEPVRIRAGALGNGLPHADLTITADHGMILDGLVINASALVNGTTIDYVSLDELPDRVTYFHIETPRHDVILANGAPSETFIDIAGRKGFDDYQDYLDHHEAERIVPEMDRPRIASRRLLPDAIKARLGISEPRIDWDTPLFA